MRFSVLLAATLLFAGCYHATIDTGLRPSDQKIEQPWAHGFIFGLVPPSTIETASKCPHGVAKVETKLSVLNEIAAWVTMGIYTPMSITVQCAAGGTASLPDDATKLSVTRDAPAEEVAKVFEDAVRRSAEEGDAVWIAFEE